MPITRISPQQNPQAATEWLQHMAALDPKDVLRELDSREDGLTDDEVQRNRALWGENRMSSTERPSLPQRLAASFADPFTAILALIAVISIATDWFLASPESRDLSTPAIIFVMIFVSAALRFVQGERSGNAAAALNNMVESTCTVERAETGRVELSAEEIVVGDVVRLGSGAVIPADLRIIHARDLFVSQAALTGESDSVEKVARLAAGAADGPLAGSVAGAAATSASVTDLANLAFAGTSVISGSGVGVVVATGPRTLIGQAGTTAATARPKSSSDIAMGQVSRLLVGLMAVMAPAVFLISGLTKGNWLDALLFSLSVAVGLTPEMLPMLVTCCLGKGAIDLSREQAIVKRLDAISDFGAIDVLCCDKTGTLTEDAVVLERHLDAAGNAAPEVLEAAFLNSFFGTGAKNLIDSAIIRRAAELGIATDELVGRFELVDELPFDFERRRLSVVVGDASGATRLVCKGALEEVLVCCSTVRLAGNDAPLTDALRTSLLDRAAYLADRGMRILGIAEGVEPAGPGSLGVSAEKDLCFVGYLAFLDPPKESAAQAVAALKAHGVDVKVLTGDSPRVAAQVCETIGINVSAVLTGPELDALDDETLCERVEKTALFAKLTPAQKARIVATLRANGHAVGFMGDGVNDAAAMRVADCGISVDSAVDVAREAADVILLKKDLAVLERGIEAGRRTLANTLKYVRITVSSNFGNIFSMLAAAIFLPFLPMGAVQLLLLNLIYNLSCTALPWDRVDEEQVSGPVGWDAASIRRFMFRTGPVSSAFDLVTFAALYFWLCPTVAGGSWGSLDATGQTLFAATFQTGWFVTSMWTQTLAVHILRTQKAPFVQSRAAPPVTLAGVAGVALATWLPFSPLADALGLVALPSAFFGLLTCVVVGYAAVLSKVKQAENREAARRPTHNPDLLSAPDQRPHRG